MSRINAPHTELILAFLFHMSVGWVWLLRLVNPGQAIRPNKLLLFCFFSLASVHGKTFAANCGRFFDAQKRMRISAAERANGREGKHVLAVNLQKGQPLRRHKSNQVSFLASQPVSRCPVCPPSLLYRRTRSASGEEDRARKIIFQSSETIKCSSTVGI